MQEVFKTTKRWTHQYCNDKQQTDWHQQLILDSWPIWQIKHKASENGSSAKMLFSSTAAYNARISEVLSRALNFKDWIQAFCKISQVRYEPCLDRWSDCLHRLAFCMDLLNESVFISQSSFLLIICCDSVSQWLTVSPTQPNQTSTAAPQTLQQFDNQLWILIAFSKYAARGPFDRFMWSRPIHGLAW